MAISFNSLASFSSPISLSSSFHSSLFPPNSQIQFLRRSSVPIHGFGKGNCGKAKKRTLGGGRIRCGLLPVDPWAPSIDSQSVASQLFAFSLFPYLGFLYFLSKVKSAPKLTRFGFYFLLAFVGATIPAGIYAKVQYGTSLSNVDWLHGGAESLLTISNLFVVLGLREALRKSRD